MLEYEKRWRLKANDVGLQCLCDLHFQRANYPVFQIQMLGQELAKAPQASCQISLPDLQFSSSI
jgi:hypothetical protein